MCVVHRPSQETITVDWKESYNMEHHKFCDRTTMCLLTVVACVCMLIPLLAATPASADERDGQGTHDQSWTGNDTNPYAGIDYYIDADQGDDARAGTSPEQAWRSLNKANAITFNPGDRILLKAGSVWNRQQLWPKGSGSADKPITIGAYGNAPQRPYIATGGNVAVPFDTGVGGRIPHKDVHKVGTTGAVVLRNQQHWSISDLELSNDDDFATDITEQDGRIRDGISISINADLFDKSIKPSDTVMSGFRISNVYVHNTDAASKWQSIYAAGVNFQVFGDKACTDYGKSGYYFSNVRIENNQFRNVELNAIQFGFNWMGKDQGYTDDTGKFHEGWEDYWVRSRDLYSRDVYIGHNYCESIGQGAIQIGHTKNALTEYNEINGFLKRYSEVSCALYMWASADSTMQYNEVYDGPANQYDGTPWDLEYTNFNVTYQFNYSHDNKAGWMAYMGNSGNSIARYNLSINDNGVMLKNMLSTNYSPTYITNNVLIYDASKGGHFHDEVLKDTVYFMNNVFYNTSSKPTQWYQKDGALDKAVFSNNDFFETGGKASVTQPKDKRGMAVDPRFVGYSGSDTTPAGKLAEVAPRFKLAADSPLIDAGRYNKHLGQKDMLGDGIYRGKAPDIGLAEVQQGQTISNPFDDDPIELEGKDTRIDLALGVKVTASSTHPQLPNSARLLVDGRQDTRWAAADSASYPISLDLDFGKQITFDEVDLHEFLDGNTEARVADYSLWKWDEGTGGWVRFWKSAAAAGIGSSKVVIFPEQHSAKLRVNLDSVKSGVVWTPTLTEIGVYKRGNGTIHHPKVAVVHDRFDSVRPQDLPSYTVNLDGDVLDTVRWIGGEGNVLGSLGPNDYTVEDHGDTVSVKVSATFFADKAPGDYGLQFEFQSGGSLRVPLTVVQGKTPSHVDKDSLHVAVETADKFKASDYTPASWKTFSEAVTQAKRVLEDPSADQEAVDGAVHALETARTGLQRIYDYGRPGDGSSDFGAGNGSSHNRPSSAGDRSDPSKGSLAFTGVNVGNTVAGAVVLLCAALALFRMRQRF